MAAAILTEESCQILDTPVLRDVDVMCKLLGSIGSVVKANYEENMIEIETKNIVAKEAPYEKVKKMRPSNWLWGRFLPEQEKQGSLCRGVCHRASRSIFI